MTKLNQLLAIEKGVSQRATRQLTDAYQTEQRVTVFNGLTRTYTPKDDDGERLPAESTRVQQTVPNLVTGVQSVLSAWFNVQFEKDTSNQTAKANVVVDGIDLIVDAPVSYLLWLEKRLGDLQTFVSKWPTLDPSDDWAKDANTGLYVTPGAETLRSRKELRALIKVEATDKFPAQTETFTADVTVGTWKTVKVSGAVPPVVKQATLDRIDVVLAAVRRAREAANNLDVLTNLNGRPTPGQAILDYVFADLA